MNSDYDDIFFPNSTRQDRNLYQRWRAEYLNELMLDEATEDNDDSSNEVQTAEKFRAAVSPFSGLLVPGEIRILSHALISNPENIPYFAVLGQWEDDFWLVAPFSRFSVPATKGELATGIDFAPLRVLQVWNARTAQHCLLRQSWSLNEKIPDKILQEADLLFRHLMGGIDLPADFSLRGPELLNPLDLRQQYLTEEKQQFQVLTTRAALLEDWRAAAVSIAEKTSNSTLRLAAAEEEKEQYLAWKITGRDILMLLTIDKPGKRVIANFVDAQNNLSQDANQYRLIDGNGTHLATVEDALAEFPMTEELDHRLTLITPDGLPLTMEPVDCNPA